MDKRLNVVWLPGWFPSAIDFLPGDFIERHAKSASILTNIVVLFVVKDTGETAKNKIEIEQDNGLVIYRGYYTCTTKLGLFSKLLSVIRYYKLLLQLYKKAKKENGPFDLAHVHIALKQGLVAIWLRWKEELNYVVTEQNAWFMPGDKKFFSQPYYMQAVIKQIFKKAIAIHVVSKSLGDELTKAGVISKSFTVIPNVVNTSVFTREVTTNNFKGLNLIAITGDTYHKNTDGVIRSFTSFVKKGYPATLHVAGPNIEQLKILTEDLGIEKNVLFYGAVSNEKVATITKGCNAMIFFTRYETFGCVMAEALCCGVPVIASRLPVLEENLSENINALFVTSEDEDDLLNKLIYFAGYSNVFNADTIASDAVTKYNYHTIAEQFKAFYLAANHLS
jgi:glycosyltransferase involved in cell wall biosynthesis